MLTKGTIAVMLLTLALTVAPILAADIDINQINMNDLQQKLPPELSNTNLTLDDAKTLLRDKCIEVAGKEAGEKAFTDIEAAVIALSECGTEIVNFTAIQVEIEKASPQGELDVVFNKYCEKRPEAIQCIEKFNDKLSPCLDKDEKENQEVFMRIIRSLLNFVCHKGGDQIALFIAEKGPECLDSKKDDIQQCINDTFSGYVPKEGLDNIKSLPKFIMGPKQCDEMEQLEECVVSKLEKCAEITPANIVESMFRFIKNETICRSTPRVAKQASAANGSISMQLTNYTIWLLAVSVYYNVVKRLQA